MPRIYTIFISGFIFLLMLSSCKRSYMKITDEFIEISEPGQMFGLHEIVPIKIDSLFGYPLEEKYITSMTLVSRKTGKQIKGNTYAKVFFGKRNNLYRWRIYDKVNISEYIETDTIVLKPKTWYRISKETGVYNTQYFYWNGGKGNFIVKTKPNPGAW
jgi:hypothetical protein